MERILYEVQEHGGAGQYVAPINEFRAASNASATALSAHTILATSAGVTLVAVGTSNVVALRLENILIRNQESWWITCELRDGLSTGQRLMGPFDVSPGKERIFERDEVLGRAAYSSIILVVLSGAPPNLASNTPPVSAGVIGMVGFVPEYYQPT